MTLPLLLAVFAVPTISIPFVYFTGKKSPKAAAIFVAALALVQHGNDFRYHTNHPSTAVTTT